MPESNQPSFPTPAYINRGDASATLIDILHIDSQGSSTEPTIPQVVSLTHEIPEDQVLEIQPVDGQNAIDLTTSAASSGSSTAESIRTNSDKFVSKLEQVIQHLESTQEDRLIERLEVVFSRQMERDLRLSSSKRDARKPIKLKDAVGRRFNFPYHRCETWTGIEELIQAAFKHVDIIGSHVNQGHYNIISSAGEVILPQLWEYHVQPGLEISMSMWPISSPKPRVCQPPPVAPIHVIVDRLPGPPPCFHSHPPPRYNLDNYSIDSKKKKFRGLWQKVKGVFMIKKRTNYDSDSSESVADN
ncbi:hypothetical protein EYC80_000714 [Monilinia laxa]|uniref:Ubiquitin-like domain-containing protein n=1 Tax=Monilinia laxa TaxID=61186 RepID=A0A5N6KBK3_MONLA|nr:hypothetical protein EYC80_000714 [Monilinia laxa]